MLCCCLLKTCDNTRNSTPPFSDATLHWVLRRGRFAQAPVRALKPGGRFAGGMGGEGNLAKPGEEGLDEEEVRLGWAPPVEASNWYASPEEFARCTEAARLPRG